MPGAMMDRLSGLPRSAMRRSLGSIAHSELASRIATGTAWGAVVLLGCGYVFLSGGEGPGFSADPTNSGSFRPRWRQLSRAGAVC